MYEGGPRPGDHVADFCRNLLGLREHGAEILLHVPLVHHAVVNGSEPSLAIDEEGIGHVFDAIALETASLPRMI